jgi:hypothetical protein
MTHLNLLLLLNDDILALFLVTAFATPLDDDVTLFVKALDNNIMVLLPCLSFVLMLCVPVTDITFTDARDHSLASKDTILVIGYDVIMTISPSFVRTRAARCMGAPGDMLFNFVCFARRRPTMIHTSA